VSASRRPNVIAVGGPTRARWLSLIWGALPARELQTTPPVPIDRGEGVRHEVEVGQVRGVLAERVVVSTALNPYLPLEALAAYAGISVRKLRDLVNDPEHPLPCYRIGSKILVRLSEYDAWAARYRQVGRVDVNTIVDEVLSSMAALTAGPPRGVSPGTHTPNPGGTHGR